jgi:hypothetical protein
MGFLGNAYINAYIIVAIRDMSMKRIGYNSAPTTFPNKIAGDLSGVRRRSLLTGIRLHKIGLINIAQNASESIKDAMPLPNFALKTTGNIAPITATWTKIAANNFWG